MIDPSFQIALDSALIKWGKCGITCNSGASAAELRILEQTTAFEFDASFRAYLGQMDGFVDFDWDEALFSFWSITRILRELNDCHPTELICFADYSINAGSFGFHRNSGDHRIYIHYQTINGLWPVAESFYDFLRIYLLDPDSLLR